MQLLSYESLIKWIVENESNDWLIDENDLELNESYNPPQTVAMLLDLTNKSLDEVKADCQKFLVDNVSTTGFANFFREYHNKT